MILPSASVSAVNCATVLNLPLAIDQDSLKSVVSFIRLSVLVIYLSISPSMAFILSPITVKVPSGFS